MMTRSALFLAQLRGAALRAASRRFAPRVCFSLEQSDGTTNPRAPSPPSEHLTWRTHHLLFPLMRRFAPRRHCSVSQHEYYVDVRRTAASRRTSFDADSHWRPASLPADERLDLSDDDVITHFFIWHLALGVYTRSLAHRAGGQSIHHGPPQPQRRCPSSVELIMPLRCGIDRPTSARTLRRRRYQQAAGAHQFFIRALIIH